MNYPPSWWSSSSSAKWRYDVFVSFRGKDTRYTFTSHLREALSGAGINTFNDERELHRGDHENITVELDEAIQGSKISIIVFSMNFAQSHWCLDELVKIMECRRTIRQMVLPAFFNVDPSDVRKQKGGFADAFEKHENWIDSDPEKELWRRYSLKQDPHEEQNDSDREEVLMRLRNALKKRVLRWRNALKQAADLAGFVVDGHNEAKVIEKIIKMVLGKLNKTRLYIAPYEVGIGSRLNGVIPSSAVECDDKVLKVGICGLGGIGKTTIAKAIYNEFFELFDGSSFLEDVREFWQQPHSRVVLQERLLFDTLSKKIEINSIARGKMVIKERLFRRRVLVIIDDVDDLEQLNAIAGSDDWDDWFGPGSIIIITTRDKHILKNVEIEYMAEKMSYIESLELFSFHAFKMSSPIEGYSELSDRIVGYCGGLPLALQVLGSFLKGRTTEEWGETIEKLKNIPHPDIQKKLRLSYDSLSDRTVKDIFLYISCFFIGEDRDYVEQILDGCKLYPKSGINLLFERCLVTINEQKKLMVHDLLRDMAREIVRENFPNNPGKWSRLWYHEDILDVLRKHKGTENMEGISLKLERDNNYNFNTKSFEKMQNLRLLQLCHVRLTESYEHISKDLRWLCWEGFPLESIPDNFDLEDLVTMELRYSNLIQVWKHSKLLEKMTYLDLSHSYYLTHTPDFSVLPNLKKLILEYCTSLHELHHSTGDLNKLVLLTLKGCECLENLPKGFYKLKSLETLILSDCLMIDHLDEDLGELVSLKMLNLEGCKILKYLPKSLYKLKSLETLILSGCLMIDHLDENLGELISLTTLLTNSTGIREPPRTILRLSNLDRLSICGFKASSSSGVSSLFWSWTTPTKSVRSVMNLLLHSFQGFKSLKYLSRSRCNLRDDNIPKELRRLPFLTSSELGGNSSSSLPRLSLWELDSPMLVDSRMHEVPNFPANLSLLSAESCTVQQFLYSFSPPTMSQARSMKKEKKHHYIIRKKRLKISSLSMRLKMRKEGRSI